MKVLILCTGNSCRSQMAEGFLKAFAQDWQVFSAGTMPSEAVHPKAIEVMAQLGVAIGNSFPKSVELFLNEEFDYVITVCGGAQESCPHFTGKVKNYLHIGFEDPADAQGSEAEILYKFKRIRDEILRDFFTFFHKTNSLLNV
ncbi:MAG TPA: arsenate reductase ArsC [Bacteroidetes bacterium]|nr:arsenate reductase ArsC [Bacteroidota bacterium]